MTLELTAKYVQLCVVFEVIFAAALVSARSSALPKSSTRPCCKHSHLSEFALQLHDDDFDEHQQSMVDIKPSTCHVDGLGAVCGGVRSLIQVDRFAPEARPVKGADMSHRHLHLQ